MTRSPTVKPLHSRPQRDDPAGELAAGRKRRLGLDLILALDDQRVEEVEPRISDLDQNLALAGRGRLDLHDPQVFRPDQATDRSALSCGSSQFYSFFSNQMQDYSPCAGRQGERPEFCPDRTAGEAAARAWPLTANTRLQRIALDDESPSSFIPSRHRVRGRRRLRRQRPRPSRPARRRRDQASQGRAQIGKKDEASKPALVATFGDWNVFVGQAGKGRICYTLAQPKSREPTSLKRDPGYAFISDRPAEGVRNEVSFIMGFDVAAGGGGSTAEIKVRRQAESVRSRRRSEADANRRRQSSPPRSPRSTKRRSTSCPRRQFWVKNAASESALIAEMRKGAKLVIKAASVRGHASTDSYSLSGFSQAMDRLQKECPPKS